MVKNVMGIGDQYAEPGTPGWANWCRSMMMSALRDTYIESRQIAGLIRSMCKPLEEGGEPAWWLMDREEGERGFRTFEEFVTSKDGLSWGDYEKFVMIATSDSKFMNRREYDLLTAAPPMEKSQRGAMGSAKTNAIKSGRTLVTDNTTSGNGYRVKKARLCRIRSIPLVSSLYTDGHIGEGLAYKLACHKECEKALAEIRKIEKTENKRQYKRAVVNCIDKIIGSLKTERIRLAKSYFRIIGLEQKREFLEWAQEELAKAETESASANGKKRKRSN